MVTLAPDIKALSHVAPKLNRMIRATNPIIAAIPPIIMIGSMMFI